MDRSWVVRLSVLVVSSIWLSANFYCIWLFSSLRCPWSKSRVGSVVWFSIGIICLLSVGVLLTSYYLALKYLTPLLFRSHWFFPHSSNHTFLVSRICSDFASSLETSDFHRSFSFSAINPLHVLLISSVIASSQFSNLFLNFGVRNS